MFLWWLCFWGQWKRERGLWVWGGKWQDPQSTQNEPHSYAIVYSKFTTVLCVLWNPSILTLLDDLKVIYRSLWIENHSCPSPAISSSIVKSLNQGCSWQLVVLAYIGKSAMGCCGLKGIGILLNIQYKLIKTNIVNGNNLQLAQLNIVHTLILWTLWSLTFSHNLQPTHITHKWQLYTTTKNVY